MTKCTASLEFSDVSLQSNKELKIGGDHFLPPPYETRVNSFRDIKKPIEWSFVIIHGRTSFSKVSCGKEKSSRTRIFSHLKTLLFTAKWTSPNKMRCFETDNLGEGQI